MKTFRDTAGRDWGVAIHVAAVRRVRAALDIDLCALVEDGFAGLRGLLSDPVRLVDVLYVVCRPQADSRGVTDEQFGEAMAGDAIEHAADALVEALVDFFQNPRARASLRGIIEKARRVRDRALDRVEAALAAIDPDAIEPSAPPTPGA